MVFSWIWPWILSSVNIQFQRKSQNHSTFSFFSSPHSNFGGCDYLSLISNFDSLSLESFQTLDRFYGELSILEKNAICSAILSGLHHLHENDICHLNLTNHTILVSVKDRIIVKIIDFNLSDTAFVPLRWLPKDDEFSARKWIDPWISAPEISFSDFSKINFDTYSEKFQEFSCERSFVENPNDVGTQDYDIFSLGILYW